MGTAPVPADWPALGETEVGDLLRRYPGAGSLQDVLFCSPRPFSSAALISTERGPLFVKRHHRLIRDAAGLSEEHRFMAHLLGAGIPVPEVLSNDLGQSVTATADWTYELHRPADGIDLYRDAVSWSPFVSRDHARSAGETLARLHLASRSFDQPCRAVQPLVSSFTIFSAEDPRPELVRYVALRPDLGRYLEGRPGWQDDIWAVLAPFHAALRPFLPPESPLWTHNDWHASNLTWSDEGDGASVRMVLDFGLADRTTALYDLATAIERNTIEWLQPETAERTHPGLVDALLDGYGSVLPLTGWHCQALAALLPLVHAEFALSETEYFHGIIGSPENTSLAYDTFLFGHARWFLSRQGARLLDHIRERPPQALDHSGYRS
ncbi:MAG: phosphotransferase [Methanobacterium sp.]|nr:phosphotransferase [Methanobacterium sp.]